MNNFSFMEKLLDGIEVEWKALEEISVKISSGGTPKTGVAEYYDGDIPWLRTQEVDFGEIWDTGVKITEAGLKNSSANWIPANCVIIAMYGATVGKIGINKIPMTTNQACANIQLQEEIANYRYIFHFLCSQYEYIKSLGAGSQTNINAGLVKKLKIPIPCPENPEKSLKIQGEIVRILDAFTAYTAELTAELTARKKQYNHYRDQLLSFKEGEVEWKTLGEVAQITIGEFVRKDKQNPSAEYPVYNGGRIPTGYYEDYNNDGDKIIVSARGANAGFVNKSATPYWAGNSCYSISVINPDQLNWIYVYYYLKQSEAKLTGIQQKGGIPAVSKKQMEDFSLPIPSLTEQAKIVAILDKFDALTNSISEGLPREIELRQQQYAYYRDLLLSFPKPDAEAAV